MTPMVDLAFLLLTFFVLTSNLNKAKTMELAVPKDRTDTSIHNKINFKLANTVLLDGNKDGIVYLYEGKLDDNPPPALQELKLDPKDKNSFRSFIMEKNSKVSADMKELRSIYKTGHLDGNGVAKLQEILKKRTRDESDFQLRVVVHPNVLKRLRTQDEKHFIEMEKRFFGKLAFREDPGMHAEQFKIQNVLTNEDLASVGS